MTKPIIFFDMDGVLTDFYGSVMEAFGRQKNRRFHPFPQKWNIWEHLGCTEKQFWDACRGTDFWANLDWCNGGHQLLLAAEEVVGAENIYLLTSPSRDPGSYAGKYLWVEKHLPNYLSRLILTGKKFLLAKDDRILVDDSDDNCRKFIEAGGLACLVPQPWNAAHEHCDIDPSLMAEKLFQFLSHQLELIDERAREAREAEGGS